MRAGWAGQRLRRLSADQQLVRFTLVNTNCSTLIKVSHISPKDPLPHSPSQPNPHTKKHKQTQYVSLSRSSQVGHRLSSDLAAALVPDGNTQGKKETGKRKSNFYLFLSSLKEHFLLEGHSSTGIVVLQAGLGLTPRFKGLGLVSGILTRPGLGMNGLEIFDPSRLSQ